MKILRSQYSILLNPSRSLQPHLQYAPLVISPVKKRSFLSFASSPQSFSAERRLSYPVQPLFNLISDVDSYSAFIPYCTSSTVTSRSSSSKLPTSAELRVGWGGFDETFTSALHCDAREGVVQADATQNSIFSVLKAKWKIAEDVGGSKKGSDVHLEIEYQFTNPLYATLSEAVMPKVAGKMIEAFERRAEEMLTKNTR